MMITNGFEVEGVIKVDNVRLYGVDESIKASAYPMQTETYDMELIGEFKEADLKRAKHLGTSIPGSGHDCFSKGIILQFDLQVSEYIWRQLDRYHFIDYVSSQSKMHRILKMDIDKACNKYVSERSIEELEMYISAYNEYEEFINYLEKYFNDELTFNEQLEGISRFSEGWKQWLDNELEYGIGFEYKEAYDLVPSKILYRLRDNEKIELTKENLFKMIIANTPSGIMLTARMTTNYLQLKSIIGQRSQHKMEEWRLLCDYFKTLPLVNEIVIKE